MHTFDGRLRSPILLESVADALREIVPRIFEHHLSGAQSQQRKWHFALAGGMGDVDETARLDFPDLHELVRNRSARPHRAAGTEHRTGRRLRAVP